MKIHFLTDSNCDIPKELEEKYGIEIKCIPISVEGKGYRERKDFTNHEFYELLLKVPEIPTTARINSNEYLESYISAAKNGVSDLVVVTICGTASGTYESAQIAESTFKSDYPDMAKLVRIHLLDSKTFTLGYGYPIIKAARMAQEGADIDEVLKLLNSWIGSVEIFLACYNLDFAKKSGRIGSAAAFVGELLGLRPVISMIEGGNSVVEKVRGDKNVVPAVMKAALNNMTKGSEYIVLKGILDEPADELAELMTEKLGYRPVGIYNIGPSIAVNAGPKIVAVAYLGKNRHTR